MVWEQAACVGPPAEVFLASLRPRLLSFFLEFDGVKAIQFMKLHEGATSMVNLSECRWEI
jgi:hypothetical protein